MRKAWSVMTVVSCIICLALIALDALLPDLVLYSNRFVKYYTCLACVVVWVDCIMSIYTQRKKARRAKKPGKAG